MPDKAAVLAMSGATTGKVSILSNPSNIKFYQNQRVGYFKKTDGINYQFISTLVRSQVFNNQLNFNFGNRCATECFIKRH